MKEDEKRMVLIVLAVISVLIAGVAIWLYSPDKARGTLEAQYAGPPSSFIEVAGLRLHVRDTGKVDGQAVVLLHGFGASLHTWEAWAGMLEAEHRVVRFDLPGFGLTGADPSGNYSDARSVAVVLALLDRLGIVRAVLVGNSMGGRIAWRFAAAHPERVEKLVLMAPDGFAGPGVAYGVAPRVPEMMRVLPFMLPSAMVRATLEPAYVDKSVMTETMLTRYRDLMLAPGVRQAILDRMAQNVLVHPEPLLRRIEAPTLLLWGEKDAMVPFSNAADYAREIPHVRVAPLEGVGHLPQEEVPARSMAVLRAFLAE